MFVCLKKMLSEKDYLIKFMPQHFILFFNFGVQSPNMTWVRLSSAKESYICNEALGE